LQLECMEHLPLPGCRAGLGASEVERKGRRAGLGRVKEKGKRKRGRGGIAKVKSSKDC
jgi:hypothetical protein